MKTQRMTDPNSILVANVRVVNHAIQIDRTAIRIPWAFSGKIRWELDPAANATFDPTEGVLFRASDAPFHPSRVSDTVWEMNVDNVQTGLASIPFKYSVTLTVDGLSLHDDPTVENESPPARTTRRINRLRRSRTQRV